MLYIPYESYMVVVPTPTRQGLGLFDVAAPAPVLRFRSFQATEYKHSNGIQDI